MLHITHCTLHTTHFTLHTAHTCTLYAQTNKQLLPPLPQILHIYINTLITYIHTYI